MAGNEMRERWGVRGGIAGNDVRECGEGNNYRVGRIQSRSEGVE